MNTEHQNLYFMKLAMPTLFMVLAYGVMHVPLLFMEGVGAFVGTAAVTVGTGILMSRHSFFPVVYLAAIGGVLMLVHKYTGLFSLTVFGRSLGPILWFSFLGGAGVSLLIYLLQYGTKPIRKKLGYHMVWVWFTLALGLFSAGLHSFALKDPMHLNINENHFFHMVAYAGMFVTCTLLLFYLSFTAYCAVSPEMRRLRAVARQGGVDGSERGDTE